MSSFDRAPIATISLGSAQHGMVGVGGGGETEWETQGAVASALPRSHVPASAKSTFDRSAIATVSLGSAQRHSLERETPGAVASRLPRAHVPAPAESPFDRPAIATVSLGSAQHHSLADKLASAAQHGFKGVELCFDDLTAYAKNHLKDAEKPRSSALSPSTPCQLEATSLSNAASAIKSICQLHKLDIICLQPLRHIEGLDPIDFSSRLKDVNLWIDLAVDLGTDLVLIPSNFLPKTFAENAAPANNDRSVLQLRQIADLGARNTPPIRFVFEALAWGRDISDWEQSWDVVQQVDRPNLGVCIDTFNVLAKVWADPQMRSGIQEEQPESRLDASLRRLKAGVDVSKVFLVQVADAEKLEPPLNKGENELWVDGQPTLMTWSRGCRLFYGETALGAYMPVQRVLTALLDSGYQGWISHEIFNRGINGAQVDAVDENAARAAVAWDNMKADMKKSTMTTLISKQANMQADVEKKGWADDELASSPAHSSTTLATESIGQPQ
ncbi:MAG: hypothetical protein M1828_005295 [Chrysothrix sp. TS-e1954]|nr:MAG: hypothetical protein M1828_005295 [Chrysothrix sp. TS-e1954]